MVNISKTTIPKMLKLGSSPEKWYFCFRKSQKPCNSPLSPYFSLSLENTQVEKNLCIPTSEGRKQAEWWQISWKK